MYKGSETGDSGTVEMTRGSNQLEWENRCQELEGGVSEDASW